MARMVAHGGGVWADDEDDPVPSRPHRRPVALLVVVALVVPLVVVALRLL